MGIRYNAHFGISEHDAQSAVPAVRAALEDFTLDRYRVSAIRVEHPRPDSLVIAMAMSSADPDTAETDAELAMEAIDTLLSRHFPDGKLRERQREFILA